MNDPGRHLPGQKGSAFPWHLLALDLFGAALAAWGIYTFAGGEGGVTYIIIGFLLMMPFTIHIINRAQGRGRARHNPPGGQ